MTHPLDKLSAQCFMNAKNKGFWSEDRNKGEQIALIHSELSEALEGIRKPQMDSHCPEFTSEEIEFADVLVRVFDYCGGHGLRIGAAFEAKTAFNESRPYKHGKNF